MPARVTLPVSAINEAARRDPGRGDATHSRPPPACKPHSSAAGWTRSGPRRPRTGPHSPQIEERPSPDCRPPAAASRAKCERGSGERWPPPPRTPRLGSPCDGERCPRSWRPPASTSSARPRGRFAWCVGHAPSPSAPAGDAPSPAPDDLDRRRTREQVRLRTALAAARGNLRRLEARARRACEAPPPATRRRPPPLDSARTRRKRRPRSAKAAARQARAELATAEEALRAAPAPA